MVWFVIAIILAVVAICALIYGLAADEKAGGIALAVLCGVLAFGVFLISISREVPTRSVGVPTAFGKVEPPLRPGVHFGVAPWTKVNILDETIQTTTFEGKDCLDVRIGGQQTACLDATIQWRVLDSGASGLFNDYNGDGPSIMSAITDAVVIRELKQTVNNVLGDYNPIQDVAANATAGNSQFSTFGPVVLRDMRTDLTGRVQVLNVLMPLLRYDNATQQRLNQIQQQYGETAIAKQQIITNEAQNEANSKISASLSHDPGVLQYQCLQIAQTAIKAGDSSVQPGWCFGSSGVIANTGK
jgi:regulator of protease activity HflC (stomatin/prohibitin superfamily)